MALGRGDKKVSLPGGKTSKFDIFAGHFGSTDVLWLETVIPSGRWCIALHRAERESSSFS